MIIQFLLQKKMHSVESVIVLKKCLSTSVVTQTALLWMLAREYCWTIDASAVYSPITTKCLFLVERKWKPTSKMAFWCFIFYLSISRISINSAIGPHWNIWAALITMQHKNPSWIFIAGPSRSREPLLSHTMCFRSTS